MSENNGVWDGANLHEQQEGEQGQEQEQEQGQELEEEQEPGQSLEGPYDGEEGMAEEERRGGGRGSSLEASEQPEMFEDELGGPQGHSPSDPGEGLSGAAADEAELRFDRQVMVNGGAVSDDVVRTAEQRAGPIHPGNYWSVGTLRWHVWEESRPRFALLFSWMFLCIDWTSIWLRILPGFNCLAHSCSVFRTAWL